MSHRPTLVLLLAVAIGACVAAGTRQEELQLAVRSYENTLRWGTIARAYEFLKGDPDNPAEPPAGLDQVRVTAYEQLTPLVPAGEKRYTTTAQIRYVLIDRQVERTLTDRQYWEWDDKGKRWLRTNPIPAFR